MLNSRPYTLKNFHIYCLANLQQSCTSLHCHQQSLFPHTLTNMTFSSLVVKLEIKSHLILIWIFLIVLSLLVKRLLVTCLSSFPSCPLLIYLSSWLPFHHLFAKALYLWRVIFFCHTCLSIPTFHFSWFWCLDTLKVINLFFMILTHETSSHQRLYFLFFF